MSDAFTINPGRLSEFVAFMTKKSNEMCVNQHNVEKGFSRLGECWDDNVYSLTGDNLAQTSKSLGKVHFTLAESINIATKYYNKYVEFQGFNNFLPERKVNEFRTIFKNGEFMGNKFNQNLTTDLGAMKDFIKNLGQYVFDTEIIMKELKKEYEAMGRDKAWKAKQYDKLGEVLYAVDKDVTKQLQNLEICKKMIEIKHRQYEELLASTDSDLGRLR